MVGKRFLQLELVEESVSSGVSIRSSMSALPSGCAEPSTETARELILIVSYPHPCCRRRKTTHEVAVMVFVRKHADPIIIPSPDAKEEELCICHRDLNRSNVVVDRSKCKIGAILDWEKAQCT